MLTLDPNVRNWVMIPITFAMLLIGILRHLVSKVRRFPFLSPPHTLSPTLLLPRAIPRLRPPV